MKHLRVQTRIDKYRAERITGCLEQKNHHHTEIYLFFKDLCFSFNRIFKWPYLFWESKISKEGWNIPFLFQDWNIPFLFQD